MLIAAQSTLPANEECCKIPTHTLDLFANYLYWRASEETSSFVANVISNKTATHKDFEITENRFDWDHGIRSGIGYHLPYDHWDTQLYWTGYNTKTSTHISSPSATITSEFFAGFMVDFVNIDDLLQGSVTWSLKYNIFDWEIGRIFCPSPTWSLRPLIGLKGGTIDQHITSKWTFASGTPRQNYRSIERVKNDFSGIGPQIGLNAEWTFLHFCNNSLKLFGDFSLATLWGRWRIKDTYRDSRPKEMRVHLNRIEFGSLTLRGFAGLGWETLLKNNTSRFTARLGYEMQLWLSHLRLPAFQQLILHGDLTLQGGTFECRFDF